MAQSKNPAPNPEDRLPNTPAKPVKAYNNGEFLNSGDARGIRVLCEMEEPQQRLKALGIENFIVFFGSARTPPPDQAEERIRLLEKESASAERDAALHRARNDLRASRYYADARTLAANLTRWSMDLKDPKNRFYICTGGGPGIMEAANRGASDVGGVNVGLGISLPFEQSNNPYITHKLSFEFHYFFVRKYWFLYLAKAMIIFPGGFGTMDELFEMLTLIQTKKTKKRIPIVLYGSAFWNDLINFQAFVDWGVISPEDLDLFHIMDDLDAVQRYITDEITEHYIKPGKCRMTTG
ncbi:MAG: LOG family protein [Opitutales bacterium]